MTEWYDFDEDFWDEYYGAEDETNMASLANDLAESTVPDINWSIFDENPTSRDLQPFDWEDDWILFEFDHDEYYDSSIRPKSSSSSRFQTPYHPVITINMEEESASVATQQQFHHDPVAVSAKNAAAIAASDPTMTDDVDDGIDGGLRKKQPGIQISQPSSSSSDKNNNGQTSRSQSSDRSIATRSRRSRTPIPNPNTGPQPGEVIEILHEDHEKKVVIVHTGGVLGKLRVLRKDTAQPPAAVATTAGPGPSPLRNALDASEPSGKPDAVDLIVDAPTPK
ncbi:uncharacterized protein DFL_009186 [Arthrobotrys flagrans]|uniref:Uncharacterized protein n=1 Tax=Arthrobotrys flagrans TaxID=97331 RepID=A0A436ZQX8_ARTFL|nr:hypothetical protein DFL_009186 [Arthrobotrys flagrans]